MEGRGRRNGSYRLAIERTLFYGHDNFFAYGNELIHFL